MKFHLIAVAILATTLLISGLARAQDDVAFPGSRVEANASAASDVAFPGPKRAPAESEPEPPGPPLNLTTPPAIPDGQVVANPTVEFPGSKSNSRSTPRRQGASSGTVKFPGRYRGQPADVTVTTRNRRQQVFVTPRRRGGRRLRPMTASEYLRSPHSPTRVYSGPALSATALRKQLEKAGVFVTQKEFTATVKALKTQMADLVTSVGTVKQKTNDLEITVANLKDRVVKLEAERQADSGFSLPSIPGWLKWVLGILLLIVLVVAILVKRGVIDLK